MFKKWKLIVALLAMVGMFATLGTGCGDDDDGSSDVKAAFIYVGPPGDAGWTYAHDQGRSCAQHAEAVWGWCSRRSTIVVNFKMAG